MIFPLFIYKTQNAPTSIFPPSLRLVSPSLYAVGRDCKRMENLPTTYLGMPLGNNHKELEIWDGIVEKTEKN
ncbi:hypothetical protein H5410_050217 [Solanum commersonii]|uniref:Uncharacterized protein n=1 Tax=Solanum commersonii TaxID=4109 RepID=A0A9J5WXB6_SOLCO|nr:hypothetical protein H5410_050217 [Solanum commersonii]